MQQLSVELSNQLNMLPSEGVSSPLPQEAWAPVAFWLLACLCRKLAPSSVLLLAYKQNSSKSCHPSCKHNFHVFKELWFTGHENSKFSEANIRNIGVLPLLTPCLQISGEIWTWASISPPTHQKPSEDLGKCPLRGKIYIKNHLEEWENKKKKVCK